MTRENWTFERWLKSVNLHLETWVGKTHLSFPTFNFVESHEEGNDPCDAAQYAIDMDESP